MAYQVKELFFTLQGEGARTGRASVFCRFAGCNLWSGREEDRAGAVCDFCDTDFIGTDGPGGGRFESATALADQIAHTWRAQVTTDSGRPYVVFTGGEPALQMDGALVKACHERHFEIAVETNGTKPLPDGIDWVCVSPKPGPELVIRSGDELKLVYPQTQVRPEQVEDLHFQHRFLQPLDGAHGTANTAACIAYCRSHPQWRLSLQTHKLLGIP